MNSPDEIAAVIAIARAYQSRGDGYALAKDVLLGYIADGADPARLAYAACGLVSRADEAYSAVVGDEPGSLLTGWGYRAAAMSSARDVAAASPPERETPDPAPRDGESFG